jgi:dTDP-glucose 4,6-dehydratase
VQGERIFLTGGTGFFGCWLLETLTWAADRLRLDVSVLVLTRDAEGFARRVPHLAAHRAVRVHEGDVRSFAFPDGNFSYVVHAATDASAALLADNPLLMFDTIVEGTRHVLRFAGSRGTRTLLLTSSGAVYGRQPDEVEAVDEHRYSGPDPSIPASAYGEGKRAAELLSVLEGSRAGFDVKIARGFAFVGPYLPLDRHFAIGNFIRDAMAGRPIVVQGDGTPLRSYLYAADLVIWLLTIMIKGTSARPYNVGSDRGISVRDLADTVARVAGGSVPVVVAGRSGSRASGVDRYVPCTERAGRELGLRATVDLDEGIRRTIRWHQQRTHAES